MNIAIIRPSTVGGIKQLAKKIKRERNIGHTEALDLASRQAGFENFVHARRRLAVKQRQLLVAADGQRAFPVFLSAHWYTSYRADPGLRRRAGREILQVNLSRPLLDVVAKHRVSAARGLYGFRMEYADHLEHLTNLPSIEKARETLVGAARSLRFMEATGLQPVTTQQQTRAMQVVEGLPGDDHTSEWFDPMSGSWLLVDEPYEQAIAHRLDERRAWLVKRGLHSQSPSWEGLYYPGACPPQLISSDAVLLQRVANALATVPPCALPDPWPHETGINGDDFVSPQRIANGKPRKPRLGPSYRNYKGATPYGGAPGIRSRWRPSQAMPVELHRQLGELMQQLSVVSLSWRVHNNLMRQRVLLEDWALQEHQRMQGSSMTSDLYYGGPSRPALTTHTERLWALAKAKALVEQGYNDCKPRRELIAALDAAASEIAASQTTGSSVDN
ncbi:DUF5623 domain-containing protein [Dyella sp.]|uniref:DUF5623 domain-containing protein n=1 Tax=Dyella sp. TaxID=1869338 RepID=UPI002D77DD7C|nr:DUF5623 domain-containing protein [Dyella sp.]HET7329911.1 DUF5623 domain-containing protein [Dyella sp.]